MFWEEDQIVEKTYCIIKKIFSKDFLNVELKLGN